MPQSNYTINCLRLSVAVLFCVPSCKSQNGDSSVLDTNTQAVVNIGDQYDTNPNNQDAVIDGSDPLLRDLVPLKAYDESHIFDSQIDQHLDHRFDTADEMKKIEAGQGLAAGTFSGGSFSPLQYGKVLQKIGRPTEMFAAASVLAAMRRMRRFYYTTPFLAKKGVEHPYSIVADRALGIPRDSYDAVAGLTSFVKRTFLSDPRKIILHKNLSYPDGDGEVDLVNIKTPFEEFSLAWNSEGTGADGYNLGVMPPFWDEIQANFYVEPPHRRHGCWTTGLRIVSGFGAENVWEANTKADYHLGRLAIRDVCTGRLFLPDVNGAIPKASTFPFAYWSVAISVIPIQMSAYNLMWIDPLSRKFMSPPDSIRLDRGLALYDKLVAASKDLSKEPDLVTAIAELPAVRWAAAQRKKGYVNMWDYIMLHRLYAWDWGQQQAVINAYFSDHKKFLRIGTNGMIGTGDVSGISIDDAKDCAAWRSRRNEDPTDGSHCKASKVTTNGISIGR